MSSDKKKDYCSMSSARSRSGTIEDFPSFYIRISKFTGPPHFRMAKAKPGLGVTPGTRFSPQRQTGEWIRALWLPTEMKL